MVASSCIKSSPVPPGKRYIFLTNIPTPYRTSFYNSLNKNNINFVVYYMRYTEGDRSWKIDLADLKHPFFLDSGFYRMFGRFHFHFNPRLIFKLLRNNDAEIIIGGAWNDMNVLVLVTLKRMGILNNQLHFWSEANYLTLGASNDNILKKIVRKYVYNSTSGAQLSSGRMTEITLKKWGVKVNSIIPLPNTIEEEKYSISEIDIRERYKNTTPIFFMPVRLHEQVKGILNFFTAIGDENTKNGIFLIAGDGPDKEAIESFIRSHNAESNIKLLGHCTTEKLVSLYKQANVFILGSFTDASPLTLVEALRMRLPILVSNRCGNHFEALEEGSNGYSFNPYDHESIKVAFESINLRKTEWRVMGERSAEMYETRFNKKMVIEEFLNKLTQR